MNSIKSIFFISIIFDYHHPVNCPIALLTEQPAPQLTAPATHPGTEPNGVATEPPIIAPATPPSIAPLRSAFPVEPQLNFADVPPVGE